ncbi:PiggyBac transposable element-derived protein [Cinara cedri]|uniref:PiggyBac transposable element-derived protein n=1 Tax=Cinara cedri TaxID=506608 RepID=A0A5E4N1Z7_9HEMI|nr:PiggyBac transposable element-derived protein [Cinara cedri]
MMMFCLAHFQMLMTPTKTDWQRKEADIGQSVSNKVVLELVEPYLDEGRCLFVDYWYKSIDLAEKLLDRNTHDVETLRANRKRNLEEVTNKN